MKAFTIVIQWLHVTSGVLWVGSAALLELVIQPLLERLPPETERPQAVISRTHTS